MPVAKLCQFGFKMPITGHFRTFVEGTVSVSMPVSRSCREARRHFAEILV